MIQKTLEQITEEDLQHLIENEKMEDKTLEYKESLSVVTPSEKKEFLADVSSFANTIGGDLIYGVEEDKNTGIPKSLKGLEIDNLDNFIGRLNSIILDGIQPRISSIGFQHIKLKNSRYVLIIRIGRSWNMPHRVIYDKHDKFYARKANEGVLCTNDRSFEAYKSIG